MDKIFPSEGKLETNKKKKTKKKPNMEFDFTNPDS